MNEKLYFIYIMSNERNGAIYIGVTSNLSRRVLEHKGHLIKGFTQRYDLTTLVHYEIFPSVVLAIKREKQLKRWLRKWKLELIEKDNPNWIDLYDAMMKRVSQ